jgi:ABC-2 type transport system permease protein
MASLHRIWAMIIKEASQLRRDPLTMAMMFAIPILQLILFGYAINADPRGLPTAVLSYDNSSFSRSLVQAIGQTGYFSQAQEVTSEAEADTLMQKGQVQFVVTIPNQFFRHVIRHEIAQIAVEADATDPATVGPAIAAINAAVNQSLATNLVGPLFSYRASAQPVDIILQRRYNPEGVTRYNIVPGLLGIILTMTMVMMTALAVTREYERGTMENLLAMPVRPLEVMIGKIAPYVFIGAVQVGVVLIASSFLFAVPFVGSPLLFAVATLLFITVNLAVGFTFSTVARNQLQAVQMSFFFMLPAILLSGFAFPFRGMPFWAQWIGEMLPATHYMRIVRGIMLKGADASQLGAEIAVLGLTLVIVSVVAVSRYRVTLD